jgi:ribosomal protein L7/L12
MGEADSIPFWQETPEVTRAKICDLILGGKPVAAMKLYRETHGIGLADAKAAIEAIIEDLFKPGLPDDSSP